MEAVTKNPRTNAQNRRLWWLAGQLGIDREAMAEMVLEFTEGRTSHTSELSFLECLDLTKFLQGTLNQRNPRNGESVRTDSKPESDPERVKLDRKRKGVIKAIFRWFELRGQQPTMEYVKGVACRAAGKTSFNEISPAELSRIYAEFCKKQRTVEAMAQEDFFVSLN